MNPDDNDIIRLISRPFNPQLDKNCIYALWRNSSFYSNNTKRYGPATTHTIKIKKQQTERIRKILQNAQVRVACLEDDPNIIIGYVVYTRDHLDWIYIKPDYRRQGIASMITPRDIETFTDETTKIGQKIIDKKKLKVKPSLNEGEE